MGYILHVFTARRYAVAHHAVYAVLVSVCPSVRPSQAGILSKRLNAESPSPDLTPWPHRAFRPPLDLPVSTSGPGPGDDLRGAQGAISPTAAGQKIEMPGRSKVGFVTQFPSVLLFIHCLSGFSCSYFLSLIKG